MADIHLAVATSDPTAVLDLYRFIKLAAIRRGLACILARSPMAEALVNREFTTWKRSWMSPVPLVQRVTMPECPGSKGLLAVADAVGN
jgi:hypothetical protein